MLEIRRLSAGDVAAARRTFALMAAVFDEGSGPLTDAYVNALLERADFWALTAVIDTEIVGGLTAHTLPLTRLQAREVFIYDIAVSPAHQRRGIGRKLVATLRDLAAQQGIADLWVLADNEDLHALDFYRALGGAAAGVTAFTFGAPAHG